MGTSRRTVRTLGAYAPAVTYRAGASAILGLVALAALVASVGAQMDGSPRKLRSSARPITPAPVRSHSPSMPTTRPASTRRYVHFVCRPGAPDRGFSGVFQVQTATQTPPTFYVTRDFSTYAPISAPAATTPTLPTAIRDLCSTRSTTSSVEWAVRSRSGQGSYLYDSADDGAHWQLVRPLGCGGDLPEGWVQFVNPTDGWLAAGAQGSSCHLFERTVDGGRSWQRLPGPRATLVLGGVEFVDATTGYASSFQPGAFTQTTDGGLTWRTVRPPGAGRRTQVFSLPLVTGTRGVLPMIVPRTGPELLPTTKEVPVTIAFDTSADAGRAWTRGPSLETRVPFGIGPGRAASYGTVGGEIDGPAVTAATPRDWWVLVPQSTGRFRVEVTDDAGSRWTTPAGAGLPRINVAHYLKNELNTPILSFRALSARIAFATIKTSLTATTTFMTTDGGAQWVPLSSFTFRSGAARYAPSCTAGQIKTSLIDAAAALGNLGVRVVFTNTSPSACALEGFPSVTAVTASGSTTTASAMQSSMYGPNPGPVTPVVMLPGAAAEAEIGGSDNPPDSETRCPAPYRWFDVAAPGIAQSVTLSAWVPFLDAYFPSCIGVGISRVVSPGGFAGFPPPAPLTG
jgi:hypothetical protein